MCAQALEPVQALAGLARPLCIAAHDAGGAEVLSSLLLRTGALAAGDVRLALAGPARAVFERKLGNVFIQTLSDALDGSGSLLCGTGWQTSFEFDAFCAARARSIPSIAVLDHWTSYRERFERGGVRCLPDALWVGDDDALRLARELLPGLPTTLVPNAYFAEMRERLAQLSSARPARAKPGLRVLYVCEPVREPALRQFGDERHWGYTEEEALQFALDTLPRLGLPIGEFVLRPHPSEAIDKYDAQLARCALPAVRGGARELLAEVADSDWVMGLNSMAMVIGLLAGKRVWCAIPPSPAACVLPQAEILMLRDHLPR